jgi:hypothetical protein
MPGGGAEGLQRSAAGDRAATQTRNRATLIAAGSGTSAVSGVCLPVNEG